MHMKVEGFCRDYPCTQHVISITDFSLDSSDHISSLMARWSPCPIFFDSFKVSCRHKYTFL